MPRTELALSNGRAERARESCRCPNMCSFICPGRSDDSRHASGGYPAKTRSFCDTAGGRQGNCRASAPGPRALFSAMLDLRVWTLRKTVPTRPERAIPSRTQPRNRRGPQNLLAVTRACQAWRVNRRVGQRASARWRRRCTVGLGSWAAGIWVRRHHLCHRTARTQTGAIVSATAGQHVTAPLTLTLTLEAHPTDTRRRVETRPLA
jgi:hypothetical protein